MAKYINVDKLLQCLPNDLKYKSSVKRVLAQAPAEDVVEVVRCKDCLFYFPPFCNRPKNKPNHTHGILPNDFCSYGERRDE